MKLMVYFIIDIVPIAIIFFQGPLRQLIFDICKYFS